MLLLIVNMSIEVGLYLFECNVYLQWIGENADPAMLCCVIVQNLVFIFRLTKARKINRLHYIRTTIVLTSVCRLTPSQACGSGVS